MKIIIWVVVSLFSVNGLGEVCSRYNRGKVSSKFPSEIRESSGLAISTKYKNRFYHINDHGSENVFYITQHRKFKKNIQEILVEGVDFFDTEDLSLGKCTQFDDQCLFIADIGDNDKVRSDIKVIIVPELDSYPTRYDEDRDDDVQYVAPLKVLTLVYPDGQARNSESFAVHPNGDLFLITKPGSGSGPEPLEIFTLPYESWQDFEGEGGLLLTKKGELDLEKLNPGASKYSLLLTGMDISPKGDKFIALSYRPIYEFNFDLSQNIFPLSENLKKGVDYNIHHFPFLIQQEAISYGQDDGIVYYSNEKKRGFKAAVRRVTCRD